MTTNYNELLPNSILFNLKRLEELDILKIDMAKKLIAKGAIEIVKIGNKIHITRTSLIDYLESNTVPKTT